MHYGGMDEVSVKPVIFEVPGIPPSVNHFKKPIILKTRNGPVRSYALTPEALAFRQAVAIFARGQSLTPSTSKERDKVRYSVTCTVFLGEGQRGDADNFGKCILDSLQVAGVIHSDARVRSWHIEVEDNDRKNPRVLICVSIMDRDLTLAEQLRDSARERING
jgi:Holliday junction resolvase RusA-like endonuclease